MEQITNLLRPDDGFGENYKYLILSVMYAELNNYEFVYTPFEVMQHNYDDDPDYINKKEQMINFKGNFKMVTEIKPRVPNIFDLIKFYHNNIEKCSTSKSFKLIKSLFYANKKNPFDRINTNIAIHIRRMNRHDYIVIDEGTKLRTPVYDELFAKLSKDPVNSTRLPGMDVPVDLYTTIIEQFEMAIPNAKFHIFSQGDKDDSKLFNKGNITLHLNESLEESFIQLVYADILITAPSSLSYTAALLSNNTIYYVDCLNPKLPHWNIIQNYKSSKMKYKFSTIDNADLAITDFNYDPYLDKFERIL